MQVLRLAFASLLLPPSRRTPFDPFIASISELTKPSSCTPTLGLAIARRESPLRRQHRCFVYSREQQGRILLTYHVARPPPDHCNKRSKNSSNPREFIIALGNSCYDSALQSMKGAIGNLDRSIQDWQAVFKRLGEYWEGGVWDYYREAGGKPEIGGEGSEAAYAPSLLFSSHVSHVVSYFLTKLVVFPFVVCLSIHQLVVDANLVGILSDWSGFFPPLYFSFITDKSLYSSTIQLIQADLPDSLTRSWASWFSVGYYLL